MRYGTVIFDGSRSRDPDGGSLGFIWDFGDGTPPVSSGPMTWRSYLRAGTFTVTLSLGIVRAAPFTLSWPGVAAGRYVLTARATDNGGLSRVSSPVTVFVETTVGVAADAYVRDGSSASSAFGGAASLQVRQSTAGNTRWTYLEFDTSAVPSIARARLRLFGALSGASSPSVQTAVYPSTNTSWSEATLTWNNKPASATSALASVTMVNSTMARWYEWDVTNYLRQEKAAGRHGVTLVLKNTSSSTVNDAFNAKESGSNAPQLAITP